MDFGVQAISTPEFRMFRGENLGSENAVVDSIVFKDAGLGVFTFESPTITTTDSIRSINIMNSPPDSSIIHLRAQAASPGVWIDTLMVF